MKRILFISDNLGPGGAQRQISTITPALKKRGCDVTVLCYSPLDFFLPKLQEANVPVVWIIEKSPFRRIIKVRKFVRKGKYDVVVSLLQTENILNILSSLGKHKWSVICGERSSLEGGFFTNRGKLHGRLMRFADSVVCNSNNAKEMWLRHYPQYEKKMHVIYNIVEIGHLSSQYHPFQDNKIHIVVAASYQYLKNPIGLIKGIQLLPEEIRNHFEVNWYGKQNIVPGGTKAFDEAMGLVKKWQLETIIKLQPETNDIFNKYNSADVVGLFSELEGLPNCICEGMMIGKPIIMSRVSDYATLVDESNGFLCDWDSAESIKDALLELYKKERVVLLEMGMTSREKAKKLFSLEDVSQEWINLFDLLH
jgi:glycosyltransferase involved in cell wall biosynthesis